jgi:hypothetical protein
MMIGVRNTNDMKHRQSWLAWWDLSSRMVRRFFNSIKHAIHLNNLKKLNSYLAENILSVHNKYRPINAVWGNNLVSAKALSVN